MMPQGFDFCPICGQDQRVRLHRPITAELSIGGQAPVARGRPLGTAGQTGAAPPPSPPTPMVTADRTVPAPGGGHQAPHFQPPAGPPPPAPYQGGPAPLPVDRTVPSPSMNRPRSAPRQGEGSLIAAVVDAQTREPPPGMPAVQASEVVDDANTTPNLPRRSPAEVSEDERTMPHPRMVAQGQRPVAIAPVRASNTPSTRPDRPGAFSGGPGHGPLPTVNRAQRGTLAPDRHTAQQGSAGRPHKGPGAGPRLVLVARDGSEGESFPIIDEQITIGRTHGDLLFPEDPFLSPMHLRLQRMASGAAIFDAGSTNGVYIRIRNSAPVYPGDQFMIGHQLLRLENIDTQVQERPPAIDGTRVFGTPLQPAWGCVRQVGRGGIVGDKYYLLGSQVVFGREGGDLLFPNDPFVSREHARLRLELHGQNMAVFLEDLESANGSYIRIRGSAEMVSMDTFRIGDQILRLRLD